MSHLHPPPPLSDVIIPRPESGEKHCFTWLLGDPLSLLTLSSSPLPPKTPFFPSPLSLSLSLPHTFQLVVLAQSVFCSSDLISVNEALQCQPHSKLRSNRTLAVFHTHKHTHTVSLYLSRTHTQMCQDNSLYEIGRATV